MCKGNDDQINGQMEVFDYPELLPKDMYLEHVNKHPEAFDYREYMHTFPEELEDLNRWYESEYGEERTTDERE